MLSTMLSRAFIMVTLLGLANGILGEDCPAGYALGCTAEHMISGQAGTKYCEPWSLHCCPHTPGRAPCQ
ncbi:hypothetical protein PGT21_016620 [Puccinia graminis f. sp. tritici]|uniref:CBM1 domain-containing protein n=1 Tax=Puccinia graminis f. sp. tritici TaxID=56615 RepID=A0A5B0R1C4_PUCGR|nr:hypothetical protein PGT21_016620 [Puccinia graminis f. sp. tritici]